LLKKYYKSITNLILKDMSRISANLTKAQVKLIQGFQNSELRYRFPATYLALKAFGTAMFPNYEVLKTREDRVIETHFNKRNKRALSNAERNSTHSYGKGDTSTLTPVWVTSKDGFAMSLKQADNSNYNETEQMAAEIADIIANFMEGFETLATAYLFNNTSSVNIATAEGSFNAVQRVFQIPQGVETRSVQITDIAMQANKYATGSTYFCDSISYAKFQFQAAQGAQNATNLSFQFGKDTYVHSVELGAMAASLATPYTKGYWIVVPNGTVSVLPWIPKQNRVGTSTKECEYTSILNPVDGENLALHYYEKMTDDKITNGMTQDVLTSYDFSQDVAFCKAPLSVAGETTILAFAIV
jgi:hypothetical protein